jgi:phosphoribosylaminoimidazole-succinocarboxamide synthase
VSDRPTHPGTEDLPLLSAGKVRDTYELPDGALLMVASDRISTYDVIHPNPIPGKGQVLTGTSIFWFDELKPLVHNHVLSTTDDVPTPLRGRALKVRRLEMFPVECVVRGYLAGSG